MPKVTLVDTNEEFEVPENAVLHDALDDLGKKLPHGCLSGSCGSCRIEILTPEGLLPPGAVEKDTIQSIQEEREQLGLKKIEIRLSCRAKVKSDITIKLIKD